jgi:hypothetical protein
MAAQGVVKDSFTFVGGLNTEGGFFITPENSWKEGVNVIPSTDGSVVRRNGIDYESLYSLYDSSITASEKALWAFNVGTWSTVGGVGNQDFFVVQTGPTLHFYDAASGSISATKKDFTVDLSSYTASGNTETAGTAVASFASTYGKLIVTTQNTDPIIIEYDSSTDTISVTEITVSIRDFEGFASPYSVDTEKTQTEWGSFYTKALYNLYNQGWTDTQIATYKTANSDKLPANSKRWTDGKDSSDVFDAALLNKQDFGSSPAPKGRYILDAFYSNRSGIITSTAYRPKVCAFFAGRVWYAGVKSAAQLGTIYFSQVLTETSKAGNCYQVNDPTSEVFSDLLDNDGGTIQIPEAGEITGLQPLGRGIIVLATNGAWFIAGTSNSGFTAADYSVERITNVGCTATKSIVQVEDSIVYWSNNGIYTLSPDQGGGFIAQNASDKNIKTFYQDIPTVNKLYAEGSYNVTNKIVYWLYSSSEETTTASGRYNKDTVLALDLRLGAWYWFSFDNTLGVIPVSLEVTKETSTTEIDYEIIAGTDDVLVSTDSVVSTLPVINGTFQQFKFLVLHPVTSNDYSITFADLLNTRDSATKFADWYTFDDAGVEQDAYVLTGYNMGNNGPARSKTGQYLTVFMRRTETEFDDNAEPLNESSCLMQTRWDFTDSAYAGKWQDPVQVYKQRRLFLADAGDPFDDGYPLVISRNKLRGRGKAVQFKFASEEGKDMQIVGWTGTFVGNTNV